MKETVAYKGLLGALSQDDKALKKSNEAQSVTELNFAAEKIVSTLHPGVKESIIYHAQSMGIELWQYLCGLLVFCAESAQLSSAVVDRVWMTGEALLGKKLVCARKECGKEFIPERRGVIYCSGDCCLRDSVIPNANPSWLGKKKQVMQNEEKPLPRSTIERQEAFVDEVLEAVEL
jgi:hypothetical protein